MKEVDIRRVLLAAQRNELTEHRIYRMLAESVKGENNRKILKRISDDELRHYDFWKKHTGEDLSPDRLYERAWAKTVLSRVKDGLRAQFERAGKRDRFEELQSCLPGDYEQRAYSEIAARLGMSEGALRVELHRLRGAYRALLRSEIAQTVTTVAEIDEELRHLIEVMQQ